MIRVLFFLLVVVALGVGFAWLADRPGDMVVTFGGYRYQTSLMVAAVMVVGLVAAIMILWWLLKSIWNSPRAISRYFRVRRRDRGYQALSSGMIAAGAGDGAAARRMRKQAAKLISSDQEPLLHLLDAQASLLDGDHDGARAKFEAMLDDPEMRLLGLRGLYLEAQRLGERDIAHHYAERASEIAPQLAWAADATLEARTAEGDWDAALRLLDVQKATRQIERDAANRRRAVLLTAKAEELLDADPVAARNAALEANRLAPDLVPAAVTAAKALFRQGDTRKGAKILEAAWKREPHPELAAAYMQARPGDSTHDRLARARRLEAMKEHNPESALAVARAALDAGEFQLARSEAEKAARLRPSEGVYLLLADIEEAETGDQGKVRQLLARALSAPRDAVWIADGVISDRWRPISPVSGKLDAFEWRMPAERIGRVIEQGEADTEADVEMAQLTVIPPAAVEIEESAATEPVSETAPPAVSPTRPSPEEHPALEPTPAAPAPRLVEAAANDDGAKPAQPPAETPRGMKAAADLGEPTGPVAPARLPDDPGVAEDEPEGESRRFRLF